jgi:KDO2-lipid IV(A) lauroyltransferase
MKDDGSLRARSQHFVEYSVVSTLGYTLRLFPRAVRRKLGALLGRVGYALDRRHRTVTLANLDLAFGDSKTEEQKRDLAHSTFEHFGSMIFELISLGKPSRKRFERLVDMVGSEYIEKAHAKGKGVILIGSHYGNWEIAAIAHGYRFGPCSVVGRALDNPYFNRWLERIRNISGNGVVYKQQAVTRVMRLLKNKKTVGLVIDQDVSQEDAVFIDFFGVKAATTTVASLIGLKTGAVLVPIFAHPLEDGRYRCFYDEAVDPDDYAGMDRQRAVFEMTQHCASVLEEQVRRNPQFWLWMHRRWKTRPEGDGSD